MAGFFVGRLTSGSEAAARDSGAVHHLDIGAHHARARVLAIADETTVTVIELETAEILSRHIIEPTKTYWRTTQGPPGRWPGGP